ncbi:MAG: PqqD family protein [Acidobacteriia bacterium]|nr:PqqD family protein [Terriglobia bacterium]
MRKTIRWQKNPIVAWRAIDGETVIISPSDNVMHELNETGSFIWRQIDGRCSAAEIAGMLAAEYEVPPEDALADTEALLQQLAASALLVTAAAADGAAC